MKEEFDNLTDKEQWSWILKQDKSKLSLALDNDTTYIYFKDELGSDNEPMYSTFNVYCGGDRGTIYLLQALGFEADGV